MKAAGMQSKASLVRAALLDGPKEREHIHALVRAVHRNAINSALLDMANAGAVESEGNLFWLHYSITSEADYRQYMRAARTARHADPAAKPVRHEIEVARAVRAARMYCR